MEQVAPPYASGIMGPQSLHSYGELTRGIMDSPLWREVMGPVLDAIDAGRGNQAIYTARELESVMLFGRVAGKLTCKGTRMLLAGDAHHHARELLGLAQTRGRKTRGNPRRWRLPGVPSEATLCRYRRTYESERNAAYAELVRRLRRHIAPLLESGLRIAYVDGTKIGTHYTPPIRDKTTGEIVNPTRVTAPEAGWVPPNSAPADHSGAGWNLVTLLSEECVPIADVIIPLHHSEMRAGVEVLSQFLAEIKPLLDDEVRVLSADGAFIGDDMREASREAGFVENIHLASHADTISAKKHDRKLAKRRQIIEGKPNYHVNGHRELACECGKASFARRAWIDKAGVAHIRTEGNCPNCGSITVTAGRWREAMNGAKWVEKTKHEVGNLSLGNPLTYNDRLASVYGKRRHAHQESFHGMLATRFRLNENKRWLRTLAQAELDKNIVFTVLLSQTAETLAQRAASPPLAAPSTGPPPPLADAA
jgi:hypothetical protein